MVKMYLSSQCVVDAIIKMRPFSGSKTTFQSYITAIFIQKLWFLHNLISIGGSIWCQIYIFAFRLKDDSEQFGMNGMQLNVLHVKLLWIIYQCGKSTNDDDDVIDSADLPEKLTRRFGGKFPMHCDSIWNFSIRE